MTVSAYCLAFALSGLMGAACLASAGKTQAGELNGVVELFTSQGCASCPPADAELARLAKRDDVLALSYHVDYWNYLGWVDTLSSRANTERQYGYARTLKRNNVYTPQAVINGQDHANGAEGDTIAELLGRLAASGNGLTVPVSASRSPDGLSIAVGSGEGKANIVAVYFTDESTVKIERGENAGQTVTYHHAVEALETVGMWGGEAVTLKLPASVMSARPGRGCAILLQQVGHDGAPGRILGAALIEPETPA
ncbi:DUF1223 domain-containing protein [Hoeflea olei]|uniref:DUF1223 domain-containing protein n=1 Tax=Hoeflea olei TaxID=1480615 RepID=A0A1C1YZW0_9HYPH|nr:DUF1223 domain-containing protein [Hoeflea olei]OCW58969.1 hypothetical protein AWJ14_04440 [Hoeflea olei]